jgi:hypothetical protein
VISITVRLLTVQYPLDGRLDKVAKRKICSTDISVAVFNRAGISAYTGFFPTVPLREVVLNNTYIKLFLNVACMFRSHLQDMILNFVSTFKFTPAYVCP